MFKTRICPTLAVLFLAMVPVAAWGAASNGTVNVSCTVEKFFQWPGAMTVTVPNITGVSQTKTQTETFTCYMNHADATAITITAADAKNGVLTEAGNKTLTTAYGLEGAGVQVGDRDAAGTAPNTAAAFLAKSYDVVAAVGSIELKLTGSATSDADPANVPNGAYTCGITLTATF